MCENLYEWVSFDFNVITESYVMTMRVYPTKQCLERSKFSGNYAEYEDCFYDPTDFPEYKDVENCYIRKRTSLESPSGHTSVVFQSVKENRDNILVYKSTNIDEDSVRNRKVLLSYQFQRYENEINNITLRLDKMKSDFCWISIMSVSVEIGRSFNIEVCTEALETVIKYIYVNQNAFSNLADICQWLMNGVDYLPLPSKFMTMLRVSPNYACYYEKYYKWDSAKQDLTKSKSNMLLDKHNLVTDVDELKDMKSYIFFLSVLFDCFQSNMKASNNDYKLTLDNLRQIYEYEVNNPNVFYCADDIDLLDDF